MTQRGGDEGGLDLRGNMELGKPKDLTMPDLTGGTRGIPKSNPTLSNVPPGGLPLQVSIAGGNTK